MSPHNQDWRAHCFQCLHICYTRLASEKFEHFLWLVYIYIYIYVYVCRYYTYIWIIPVCFLSPSNQTGTLFSMLLSDLEMFSRRSSVDQTLTKIQKSDVDGKSCQNIELKGNWTLNSMLFVILKTKFTKRQLIKITIAHVYIKPEVDTKSDTTAMVSLYSVIRWKLLK